MADQIRTQLAAVRSATRELNAAAKRSASAARAAETAARDLQARAPTKDNADAMRWTSRMAERSAEGARLAEAAAVLADRVDGAGTATLDADAIKQMGSDARSAKPLPDAAASQLASAQGWVAMARDKPVMRRNRDARTRLGRLSTSLRNAARHAKDAKDAAAKLWEAMGQLTRGWNSNQQPPVPPVPPPVPPVLSSLDIKSLGDAKESLVFAVTRTGDASLACSVTWTKSGTTDAANFADGTQFAGELAWDAGASDEQRIELVLSDTVVQAGQETTTITLSEADNATIGTAAATAKLDVPPAPVEPPAPTEPDDPSGLPVGFPQPPTFSGPVTNVSTRQQLMAAITGSSAGDNRIRCAGGVNYGTIQVDRPTNHRFEIICTVPPFESLNTKQRDDLRNTSFGDTNARDKVVVKPRTRAETSSIWFKPVQAGVFWLEGFWLGVDQQINAPLSERTVGDLWIRRCRFDTCNAHHVRIISTTSKQCRLVSWENWHWADGTAPAQAPNPQAPRTDYGYQLYNLTGFYAYKTFFEGGLSHPISIKYGCGPSIVDSCVFMPWNNKTGTSQTYHFQIGQEGSTATADRTNGYFIVRNCTMGDWTIPGANPQPRGPGLVYMSIRPQDTVGGLIENNLFYPTIQYCLYSRTGSTQSKVDVGVKAGCKNIIFRGNKLLGKSQPFLNTMYDPPAGGYTITFSDNKVPATINVSGKQAGVVTVHGPNSGFSG